MAAQSSTRKSTPYTPDTVFKFPGKGRTKRENTHSGLDCDCRPYVDILTAGRWRALGAHVKSGEHANLRVGRFGNTPIFCRCQVARFDGSDPDPRATLEESAALLADIPF